MVDGEERLYSEKMACVDCGISVPAIEPRTFSFNSIYGACETCHGLGLKYDFDPSRMIADPSRPRLPVAGLAPTTGLLDIDLEEQVQKVAQQLGIDISLPYEQLPQKAQHAVFYGTRDKGRKIDGVVDLLNNYYDQDTPITEDIADFMVTKPCAACHGSRLRPEALAIRIDARSISEVVAWPINQSMRFRKVETAKPRGAHRGTNCA